MIEPGRVHFAASLWRRYPEIPTATGDVRYGFGRIDASGRVADRAVTGAEGVVLARRDPGGPVIMSAKPYVAIPAALRHRCGLEPGDRILLAAFLGQDALAAYSFAVVDQALRAHVPFLCDEGGRS